MARVKIEDIVDHLDNEFRAALQETYNQYFPDQQNININALFQTFKNKVYQKCSGWEYVPD